MSDKPVNNDSKPDKNLRPVGRTVNENFHVGEKTAEYNSSQEEKHHEND